MARGGKQPGAGRPKGSTNVPKFGDYVTEAERKKFVEFVLETYMGDMNLARWMGDHLFAKPVQSIDHTTKGEKLPTPILSTVPDEKQDHESKD